MTQRPAYLFVLPWSLAHVGGVNQVVINLAREMIRAGTYDPIVLVSDWQATAPVWEDFAGVTGLRTVRWRLREHVAPTRLKEALAFAAWKFRFQPAFQRFCSEHRVAVINPHYPVASTLALMDVVADVEPKLPVILSFHGADVNTLSTLPAADIAPWRNAVREAAEVVVCSRDLGQKLRAVLGDQVMPHVIHNGLDAAAFVAGTATNAATPSPASRRILNVAKFETKKGQDVLIRAFATLAADHPDVQLVLVGGSDEALPGLRELCLGLGVSGRVEFHTDVPHDSVARYFAQASLFVLPSRKEPFGIVLLEAGAFALPVIASRVDGIPEILSDGLTGLLVAPDDPAALAGAIRSLLVAPAQARDLGIRLHEHVVLKFTWTAAWRAYTGLLQAHGAQARQE